MLNKTNMNEDIESEEFKSEIETAFDLFEDDFLKFDKVENKLSSRPDIHAFILLNNLFPDTIDIIAGATHDAIWLEIDPELLAKTATKEQIQELVRCGVRYDSSIDSITMFV